MTAVVVGTAGHIDHGKTALVKALTGVDTDRLPVEKQRGITTELGFAPLVLDGQAVALIDVPGHERFVKSMVAGATGIDVVVMVIAADEGVMPQTREHLAICDLLGVRRGVIALTKVDLVDDALLALARQEVAVAVAGTFLEGAPVVPVSVRDGRGLDELRRELARAISAVEPRPETGVFRLALDRVFTKKGFGTIVTGTVLGGSVRLGDELVVIPSGLVARVRGIESHGHALEVARAGQRCALNLGGVAVAELARGDMVVHPGKVGSSHILDVDLRYLVTAAQPLPPRSKVLLHHATAQVLATLVVLDGAPLAPGGHALAQLRIDRETPLGALVGDHFIVRGFTSSIAHGATLGGGTVLRVLAPRARRSHAEELASIATAQLDRRIAIDVKSHAAAGLTREALVQRTGIADLSGTLADLVARGELVEVGELYLHAETVAGLERQLVAGLEPGPRPREALRGTLPAALAPRAFDTLIAGLLRRGQLVAEDERLARATATRGAALAPLDQQVLAKLLATGVEPPRPKELAGAMGLAEDDVKPALERLLAAKLVTKIKPDLVMHARVVDDLRTRLLAFLAEHATIDAQQWKELTRASRKFTIPLAEFFDGEKLTLRIGDVRRKRRTP